METSTDSSALRKLSTIPYETRRGTKGRTLSGILVNMRSDRLPSNNILRYTILINSQRGENGKRS